MAEELPHHENAERVVLGSMMIAPHTIEMVTERLTTGMFHQIVLIPVEQF